MLIESHCRSLIKSVLYRCLSTVGTSLLVFLYTGQWRLAVLAGGIEALFKLILYYSYERLWNWISFGKIEVVPPVIWFTGLSGAGKTTLATEVKKRLIDCGYKAEHLDGDEIRKLIPATGFGAKDREEHIKRVGVLASYLQRNGIAVVTSLISPYEDSRKYSRALCKKFYEIYLSTSLEVCEQRDPKGLYQRVRNGEISQFTGIDAPYELPSKPDLILDTSTKSIDTCVSEILELINQKPIRGIPWSILNFWSLKPSSS